MAYKLALKGGEPVRRQPFTGWPVFGEREQQLLTEVLESGRWSFNGPKEEEFARRFAVFCGAEEVFCVANGSVSLEIALRALGVGPGDEVIVPAITWIATAWAVLQVGATPVFADVREQDWCIDPASIREKITPRTRAVIPVHLYSQIAEMDEILEIARSASLWVIEDCAHAHGSRWGDRSVGTLGHVGSFSFQQSKGITSGEGGALVTNDPKLAQRIYGLKNCGRPWKEGGPFGFGGNYRMTEFQAAILLAQLERLEVQLAKKAENVNVFREQIAAVPGVSPLSPKGRATRQGMYMLALRYDRKAFEGLPREVLIAALKAEGIPAQVPYSIVYRSPLWTSGRELIQWGKGDRPEERLGLNARCPVAEEISEKEGLTIPHEVFLGSQADLEDLVAGFAKVQRYASELRLQVLHQKARHRARTFLRGVGLGA